MKRRDLQNWLFAGPPQDEAHVSSLGLPEEGPGSKARLGRRIAALFLDWWASWLVAYLILGDNPFGALGIFALEQVVLLATMGSSFGHRLCGMIARRVSGTSAPSLRAGIGLVPALVRTVLLCLVIPAVVWDADGRGLHDKAAGTVLLRR